MIHAAQNLSRKRGATFLVQPRRFGMRLRQKYIELENKPRRIHRIFENPGKIHAYLCFHKRCVERTVINVTILICLKLAVQKLYETKVVSVMLCNL